MYDGTLQLLYTTSIDWPSIFQYSYKQLHAFPRGKVTLPYFRKRMFDFAIVEFYLVRVVRLLSNWPISHGINRQLGHYEVIIFCQDKIYLDTVSCQLHKHFMISWGCWYALFLLCITSLQVIRGNSITLIEALERII